MRIPVEESGFEGDGNRRELVRREPLNKGVK